MLSMTGYGKGEYIQGGLEMTVEIKTVNNRYLDVSVKAPRIFAAYEDVIRTTVRKKLTRGHADVFVSVKDKRERPTALSVDLALAKAYISAVRQTLSPATTVNATDAYAPPPSSRAT